MSAASWTAPAFERIAAFVRSRTGLDFAPNRLEDAENGAARAMKRAGAADAPSYLRMLESGEAPLDDLAAELTVGETYFFREPAQLDFIRREVLPERAAARGPEHALRVWSAGCASGEEAYTLAILLEEAGLAGRSRVMGTDISRPSLAKARLAVYGRWSFRGEKAGSLDRFFSGEGERRRLDPAISRRVDFEYLNLALDRYPTLAGGIWGLDLILCRNVLIYFDRETVSAVARRLYDSLAEGGWLITGPSDPVLAELAPFETVVTPAGVFYRRAAAKLAARPEAPPAFEPFEEPSQETALVRAAAKRDGAKAAERVAAAQSALHPSSAEAAFLRAAMLMDLQRDDEAARALRRTLYLDPSLLIAHFMLGCVLRRRGDAAGARRAYRNARELGMKSPAGELVALSEGETVERLLSAVNAELALLAEPA